VNRPKKQQPIGSERAEILSLVQQAKAAIVSRHRPIPDTHAQLTTRQKEVLSLVLLGKNNSEIASELFISLNTVMRHMTNIFARTKTCNRVELAVFALNYKLI
jgi:NarL family two-component system response regulator LiaR